MDGGRPVGHGLAQKLSSLENSAACVASAKAHLRANAESVRKDISDCFSQQLSLLRAREQELLSQVDWAVARKEATLSNRQHALHQSIGSCKQALESLNKDGSNSENATKVLSRLKNTDSSLHEVGRIEFEKDSLGLRSTLASFGCVRTVAIKKDTPLAGDSLPLEMEEYGDDVTMTHKSVLRLGSAPATPSGQAETVKRWLTKIPSGTRALDADMSALMAEFEVIKTGNSPPAEMDQSSDCASFEVMSEDTVVTRPVDHKPNTTAAAVNPVLSREFVEMLQRPLSEWLLKVLPPAAATTSYSTGSTAAAGSFSLNTPSTTNTTPSVFEKEPRKRRHSVDTPIEPKKYGFETVIRDVRRSNRSGWCLPRSTATQPPASESSPSSDASEAEASDNTTTASVSAATPVTSRIPSVPASFDERQFINGLHQLFNTAAKSTTPAATDVPAPTIPSAKSDAMEPLQSVLYWKNVLDKIQSSSSWLSANNSPSPASVSPMGNTFNKDSLSPRIV